MVGLVPIDECRQMNLYPGVRVRAVYISFHEIPISDTVVEIEIGDRGTLLSDGSDEYDVDEPYYYVQWDKAPNYEFPAWQYEIEKII